MLEKKINIFTPNIAKYSNISLYSQTVMWGVSHAWRQWNWIWSRTAVWDIPLLLWVTSYPRECSEFLCFEPPATRPYDLTCGWRMSVRKQGKREDRTCDQELQPIPKQCSTNSNSYWNLRHKSCLHPWPIMHVLSICISAAGLDTWALNEKLPSFPTSA